MEYAGFRKRCVASVIDALITTAGGFAIGFVLDVVLYDYFSIYIASLIYAGMVNVVVRWLYFALLESSPTQATVGKMILDVQVADLDGNRIGFAQATGRHFGKMLSGLTVGIGYAMAAFTEQKQGLHDKMAGCLVINR